VAEVFVLNIGLATLAIGSTVTTSATMKISFLIAGGLAAASLIYRFARRHPSP
jgi:membrane protein implicated in regulation of membrane protease activity